MYKCCWHGTLLHFSLQNLHLNNCYYHQDLHLRMLNFMLPKKLRCKLNALLLLKLYNVLNLRVEFRYFASAPSIFRASSFDRWVVTHSLADDDFHDHRPAVFMNQHLFWNLHERKFWHLNSTFGSSHIASSAYQKWPTKNFSHLKVEFN